MPSAAKPKAKSRIQFDFEAIGTVWHIECQASAEQASELSRHITARIEQFDKHYSRFRSDSWVTRAGSHPGTHKAPADFGPLFKSYQTMYAATNGAVTPLIGDALERAGYDRIYSLKPKKLRQIPALPETLEFKDNTLHVKYPCVIDFGAAGKGYLVDIVCELLQDYGVTEFVVDAGGDIRCQSPTPTPVGLENPDEPTSVIGVVPLHNRSICASAGHRRSWGTGKQQFHHIINPQSLKSEDSVKATWAIANTALLADGLATCLFFTDPDSLQKQFDFEYVCLMADNSVQVSSKLKQFVHTP